MTEASLPVGEIICGDCLDVLATFPPDSVDCCVTSPPYWGLRDYGADGQLGLEPTPELYVASMVAVFEQVRRVLKPQGTLWLNLGDSYSGTADRATNDGVTSAKQASNKGSYRAPAAQGCKPKDLIGIPWRVAFALQQPREHVQIASRIERAWLGAMVDGEGCITILETHSSHDSGNSYPPVLQIRMCDTECIEHTAQITSYGCASPPQEPPSTDGQRPSYQWRISGRKAADIIAEVYPYLYIKRKQAIIAWNLQAVRDSYETKRGVKIPADALAKQQLCRELIQSLNQRNPVDIPSWMKEPTILVEPGWYLRSDIVWSKPNPMPESVTDRPTKSHEHVFLLSKSARYWYDAAAIAEHAINAGLVVSTNGNDGMDAGYDGHRTRDGFRRGITVADTRNARDVWTIATEPYPGAHFATFPTELPRRCILAGCPAGGVVLDPFMGSGTVGLVATQLGRQYVGIELSPQYAEMARKRTAQKGLFTAP